MDSTTDPSGDLSASESAEETSPKSEEQQDGRFSFAELYTYIKDGRYPSSFVKVDKQALRELKFSWLKLHSSTTLEEVDTTIIVMQLYIC